MDLFLARLKSNKAATSRLMRTFRTSSRMLVYILAKSNVCRSWAALSATPIPLFISRAMCATRRESESTQAPVPRTPASSILAFHMSCTVGIRARNAFVSHTDRARSVYVDEQAI